MDLPSVESTGEDARAFLQARTVLWARVWIVLLVGFLAVGQIARARAGFLAPRDHHLVAFGQLGCILGFCGIWFRARKGRRTTRELRFYEAVGTVAPLIVVACTFWFVPVFFRPETFVLSAFTNAMMARAVIIPSTAHRTLVLGIALEVLFVAGTYGYYRSAGDSNFAPPVVYTLVAFAWSSATVVISTVASHTIFGLRKQVREVTELGQYRLEQKLGEGGMGVVYRASHLLLRRPTAIKLLLPSKSLQHDLLRFEREVQITSLLTHPNTIAIYDYGRTPDGIFYYAMELVEGLDLQELVEAHGPQPPGCVAHIVEQICGALDEAHGVGLIHRDIKPANVLLCERGKAPGFVKVVDFGLVKSVESHSGDLMLSQVDVIVGTPLYLSPEAISQPSTIDHRSDLYALGAVAYFLLTGGDVFRAASIVEVCGHHLHTEPAPPSERLGEPIPSDLESLVLSCLAKDRERRPQSAAELARKLRELPCRAAWTDDLARSWWSTVRKAHPPARERRSRVTADPKQTLAIDWNARNEPPKAS